MKQGNGKGNVSDALCESYLFTTRRSGIEVTLRQLLANWSCFINAQVRFSLRPSEDTNEHTTSQICTAFGNDEHKVQDKRMHNNSFWQSHEAN